MNLPLAWSEFDARLDLYLGNVHTKIFDKAYLPPENFVLNAFKICKPKDIKVLIIGQDPYHGKGQANGLAFSVNENVPLPPSLKNIYRAIDFDFGKNSLRASGNLIGWARQGVFLLNTILTVEESQPASHADLGWEDFTSATVRSLSEANNGLVFMLWGKHAQSMESEIKNKSKHCILKSSHPSPLSAYRGFLKCKHFSYCNAYLVEHGKEPVDWYL
jgi:uracil-DNA glycosylase